MAIDFRVLLETPLDRAEIFEHALSYEVFRPGADPNFLAGPENMSLAASASALDLSTPMGKYRMWVAAEEHGVAKRSSASFRLPKRDPRFMEVKAEAARWLFIIARDLSPWAQAGEDDRPAFALRDGRLVIDPWWGAWNPEAVLALREEFFRRPGAEAEQIEAARKRLPPPFDVALVPGDVRSPAAERVLAEAAAAGGERAWAYGTDTP
ncbi:MAG: hypothetical protein AAF845_09065 [Bacteroidota bacterium]